MLVSDCPVLPLPLVPIGKPAREHCTGEGLCRQQGVTPFSRKG